MNYIAQPSYPVQKQKNIYKYAQTPHFIGEIPISKPAGLKPYLAHYT